ncbi:unnamed protein product [Withania somnifera]
MDLEHLALNGAGTIGARGEEECEGVWIRGAALPAHLGVERKTTAGKAMGRICLNELVVEEDGWLGNIVEYFVGVRDVWYFNKFGDQELCKVDAISESVGVYLFQLVHKKCLMRQYTCKLQRSISYKRFA